jgi:glutathione peroxidase
MKAFVLSALAFTFACNTSSSTPAAAGSGGASSSGATSNTSGGAPSKGAEAGASASGGKAPPEAFKCNPPAKEGEFFALSSRDIADYEDISMCQYRGQVLLVFNGASKCGNTPQYRPLQELFKKYEVRGFAALGFPCNQFGGQEPGSGKDIGSFCTNEYGITFPMFSKLEVNGAAIHPIFKWLKAQAVPSGDPTGDITWNFEKFLVGRDGKVARRFSPETQPDAASVVAAIEAELAKPVPAR